MVLTTQFLFRALATSYLNKIGNGVEREEAEAMLRTLRLSVVG